MEGLKSGLAKHGIVSGHNIIVHDGMPTIVQTFSNRQIRVNVAEPRACLFDSLLSEETD